MIDLIEKTYSEIGIGASEILMCEVYRYCKSIHIVFLGHSSCCCYERGAIEILNCKFLLPNIIVHICYSRVEAPYQLLLLQLFIILSHPYLLPLSSTSKL